MVEDGNLSLIVRNSIGDFNDLTQWITTQKQAGPFYILTHNIMQIQITMHKQTTPFYIPTQNKLQDCKFKKQKRT